MTPHDASTLEKNHSKMFVIRSLVNIRMINVVLSLFYLSRGLTLSQIFYANIFWAVATLLFEVPSSYLADYWGRKNTLLLGCVFALVQWIIFYVGEGFLWMSIGIAFYGLFCACFSGTDQALIYDTDKALKKEDRALHSLGVYESAQHLLKILAPVVAVLFARDLTAAQFHILIGIDIIATVIACIILFRVVEPDHTMDIHTMEVGIVTDGWKLFFKEPFLFRVILNKEILFFNTFILTLFFQSYFVDLGASVLSLGIGYGIYALIAFFWNHQIAAIRGTWSSEKWIDIITYIFTICAALLAIGVWRSWHPLVLVALIEIVFFVHVSRYVFFQDVFQKRFSSYNRATTTSLANALHNVIQLPIFVCVGMLIERDVRLPFVITALSGVLVVFFFGLKSRSVLRYTQ